MHTPELVARLYKKMTLIRRLELRIAEIYHTDAVKSPVHLSVGQESIAVGVCDPLERDDIVSNTYRCHATYLAKGGDLKEMMAELYGKKTGCAGGKAGSMHLVDMKQGILGASAVVGTTIPVATGYALALQMKAKQTGKTSVVVSLFGDGGTEEGCFTESINFAALHQLPIIYVCENNRLAIHTPLEKRWATEKLCQRVETYGIKTVQILDADVFKIRETITKALADIRQGHGPIFLECATYRWLEHVGPRDDHTDSYRDPAVYQQWIDNDQIKRLGQLLDESVRMRLDEEVTLEIQAAETFAEQSPYPLAEELYTHVYAS
ncbi:MAG: thiamine pyrophosphate-dependent dehydrogenase E1 component subunit alpha [Gammaproteobacteria bacterium]|nr:thiamine pyrophosphate-dependent dehydrogenase E1 component subunit alpha [Gammaproteobacteria bacterium]